MSFSSTVILAILAGGIGIIGLLRLAMFVTELKESSGSSSSWADSGFGDNDGYGGGGDCGSGD